MGRLGRLANQAFNPRHRKRHGRANACASRHVEVQRSGEGRKLARHAVLGVISFEPEEEGGEGFAQLESRGGAVPNDCDVVDGSRDWGIELGARDAGERQIFEAQGFTELRERRNRRLRQGHLRAGEGEESGERGGRGKENLRRETFAPGRRYEGGSQTQRNARRRFNHAIGLAQR